MIEPMTYVIPVQCSDLPTKLSKQLNCMQPVTLTQGRIKRKGAGGAQPPSPPWDEAFFFELAFKICLPHRSVTSFLRGAPPPEKDSGSDVIP